MFVLFANKKYLIQHATQWNGILTMIRTGIQISTNYVEGYKCECICLVILRWHTMDHLINVLFDKLFLLRVSQSYTCVQKGIQQLNEE